MTCTLLSKTCESKFSWHYKTNMTVWFNSPPPLATMGALIELTSDPNTTSSSSSSESTSYQMPSGATSGLFGQIPMAPFLRFTLGQNVTSSDAVGEVEAGARYLGAKNVGAAWDQSLQFALYTKNS